MSGAVPHTMRAVRLAAYQDVPTLEVRSVAVPWPGPGQVLVRVSAAPLHFDDVVFCRGRHGFRRAVPTTPGVEGAGEVVAVGGGLVTRWLVGKRVAFAVAAEHDGAWAEYAVVDAGRCMPLWNGVDDEHASTLLVDPVTALALLDEVRAHRHPGAILTAPGQPVGRTILQLARAERLPVVLVAHDEQEAAAVRREATETLLVADAPDFDARLRRATRAWKASVVLDGVGGELTGRLLAAMPDGAEAILYGIEPGTRVEVDLSELVYRRKRVRGFSFLECVQAQGPRGLLAQRSRIRRHAADAFRLPIARRIGLEEVPEAVAAYQRVAGTGRVIVRPRALPEAGGT